MRFKIILALVKTEKTDPVVDAAKEAGATGATVIPARGTGIAFVLPVEHVIGLESQMKRFTEGVRDQYF
jgi:hypothetical protein